MRQKDKFRKHMKKENKKWPVKLKRMSESQWPKEYRPDNLKEVWRSKDYLVQLFKEDNGIERMSVNSTMFNGRRWTDNIKWETLQKLKKECGRGHLCAVEIYPSEKDIVNVANMRHLWVLPEVPEYCWKNKNETH